MSEQIPTTINFQQSFKVALANTDASKRLDALLNIAQGSLSFLDTIQLDKAVARTLNETTSDLMRVRVAVLASCTIDHLLPAIRVAGLGRGLLIEVYAGAFGQYRQELLDPGTKLKEFKPDIILLSLTSHEMMAGIPLSASSDEVEKATSQAIAELRELWKVAHGNFNAAVIQQSFLDVSEPLFGNHDQFVPGSPAYLINCLNNKLANIASQEGVMLLDVTRASARDGIDRWFDITRWLQGKLEIAPQISPRYGDLVARLIAAQLGLSKKCLVLDLDNTLWGGVIGDDGIEGIVLGEGSAVGEAHLHLQRYAKLLKDRGIILAVCSKNESTIAEAAFSNHPEMILERSDIAAFVANWNDKAENLRLIASQLNIGLDSMVLVDDNPAERARVRESLPIVAVPELPDDPAYYVHTVANGGYFEAISFTNEDQQRTGQYNANIQREALQEESQSIENFLKGMNMSVSFGPIKSVDLNRAAQLINKTNQFNTTTRRYTLEEVSTFSTKPEAHTLQFRLYDRFGDNGLVSVMILHDHPEQPGVLEILNWVMSCRVFGRQLEHEVMNIAVEAARARGARELQADFIPTEKNVVINKLFETLGYSQMNLSDTNNGASRWLLNLDDYSHQSNFISREESM